MKNNLFGGFPGARFIGKEELDEVAEVLHAQSPYRFYGLNLLKRTEKLENLCCKVFKRKFALALSSGTAALHTALFSVGVSEGDEVIIPSYAWSANLMSILALRAIPVIVPVDENLNLDTSFLEKNITSKTKVIFAVHMRGVPCDLQKICEIAKSAGIYVIEDGAQCIGGVVKGLPVGARGDVSILSFQYNKLITAGEGGVLLTNNLDIYKRASSFHDLGMLRSAGRGDPQGVHAIKSFGLNYRMSELQAAVLLAQLKKMKRIKSHLKRSYGQIKKHLDPLLKDLHLKIRPFHVGHECNYAFFCFSAPDVKKAENAYRVLVKNKIPLQRCSHLDSHHFEVWKNYLLREKKKFRLIKPQKSASILKKSFYIEVNAL